MTMNMPTPSKLPNPDIERIRFVTERFTELEGLIPATFGASLIIGALLAHGVGHVPGREPGRLVLMMTYSMVGFGTPLHGLYRRTFGDVVATIRRTPFSAVISVLVMLGVMADLNFPHSTTPRPSFAAVALTLSSIWIVLRDGRWRVHYLVAVAAGVAAVAVTGAVPSPDRWHFDAAGSEAHLLAYSLIGLGILVAGLFDHHLLASTLRPARLERDREPEPAGDPAGGGLTRVVVATIFCAAGAGGLWALSVRISPLMWPLFLLLALLVTLLLINRLPVDNLHKLDIGTDTLVLIFLLALAATIDGALLPRAAPGTLAIAIGLASAWTAAKDWPHRQHYLIGTVASAIVVVLGMRVDPARALAIFVLATAGAIAVEALIDWRQAGRLSRPVAPSA
jgi:hypothetical protein